MAQNSRWRFNPFTVTYQALTIASESHTIEYHAEFNAYGIFCDEAIQFDNPSSVTIAGYTEVSRLTTPTGVQFRVDYATDTFYNTGFIEFHSSKNGLTVTVAYKGRGTLLHPTFRTLTDYNYAGDVYIEGTTQSTSTITGALKTAGGAAIAKNAYIGGNLDVIGTSRFSGSLVVDNGSISMSQTLIFNNIAGEVKASIIQSDASTLFTIDSNSYGAGANLRESGYANRIRHDNVNGKQIFYISQNGLADAAITYTERFSISNTEILTPGIIKSSNTTASTSTTTGSGVFSGGLGVAGAGWFGGVFRVTDTTASTSTTTGSGVFSGGLGVAGAGWFKGGIIIPYSSSNAYGIWCYGDSDGIRAEGLGANADGVIGIGTRYGGNFIGADSVAGGSSILLVGPNVSPKRSGVAKIYAIDSQHPPATANYCFIYGYGGNVWVRGTGATTQISPHNDKGEWIYNSYDDNTGKKVYINMEKFITRVGELLGENFFEVFIESN